MITRNRTEIKNFKYGIYKHWKRGDLYRAIGLVFDENPYLPRVIYYRCDENGVFCSIREDAGKPTEIIIDQPFSRPLFQWNEKVAGVKWSKEHGQVKDAVVARYELVKEMGRLI